MREIAIDLIFFQTSQKKIQQFKELLTEKDAEIEQVANEKQQEVDSALQQIELFKEKLNAKTENDSESTKTSEQDVPNHSALFERIESMSYLSKTTSEFKDRLVVAEGQDFDEVICEILSKLDQISENSDENNIQLDLDKYVTENQDLKQSLVDKEQELIQASDFASQLESKYVKVNNAKLSLEKECLELKETIEELSTANNDKVGLQSTVSLEEELKKSNQEIENHKQAIKATESFSLELEHKLANSEKEKLEVEENLSQFKAKLESQAREVEGFKAAVVRLEEAESEALRERESWQEVEQNLRSQVHDLSRENSESLEAIETLKNKLAQLSDQDLPTLQNEVTELKSTNEKLRLENQTLLQERNEISENKDHGTEEIESLKNQIITMEEAESNFLKERASMEESEKQN